MAEQIKDLIEKIQQDGLKVAENNARAIEQQARQRADEIISKAKKNAEKIVTEGRSEVARMEESTRASLQQAGRDLILSLKKEINSMLDKLIELSADEVLKPEELFKIITALIKNYKGENKENIIISLKKEDLKKLEKGLLAALGKAAKRGVNLKAEDDISGGFIISYDFGKSHFDFTDRALSEYIGTSLKPKLKEILK
ncbi:MAG: hypothetical protein ABIG56_01890 [Candidatus Omnitrophota bacterium]